MTYCGGIHLSPSEDSPRRWQLTSSICFSLFMMTSSNGNTFRVTGLLWSPVNSAQRLVTRSFDDFFDLRLNELLSKQSWAWWFEKLSRTLWRHRNGYLDNVLRKQWVCRWISYFSAHMTLRQWLQSYFKFICGCQRTLKMLFQREKNQTNLNKTAFNILGNGNSFENTYEH